MNDRLMPQRTYYTELSDDALLIFDALFDGDRKIHDLRRENYAKTLGVSYTHGLELLQMEKALSDLVMGGYLTRYDDEAEGRRYGLTEDGGDVWEAERRPVWERYCRDEVIGTGRGAWVVVRSPALDTAREFLETTVHAGLYAIDPATWEEDSLTDAALVPWKIFPEIHEVRVLLATVQSRFDPEIYEQYRSWWRTIPEMALFAQ